MQLTKVECLQCHMEWLAQPEHADIQLERPCPQCKSEKGFRVDETGVCIGCGD